MSTTDAASATTTDPALCGACSNVATITCSGCNNMKYCSQTCQQQDQTQHSMLCSSFQNLEQRPSPGHFRSIYFPVDADRPRFFWLHYKNPTDLGAWPIDDGLGEYIGLLPAKYACFSRHYGLNRQFENSIDLWIKAAMSSIPVNIPVNTALRNLLPPKYDQIWRGPFLARGLKHRVKWGQDSTHPGLSIPMDLDTTSLAPIVAYLVIKRRQIEDEHALSGGGSG